MNNGITIDNKAFTQVEEFLNKHPTATYQEITNHISWYFEEENFFNFSPFIVDWILLCMEKYKKE